MLTALPYAHRHLDEVISRYPQGHYIDGTLGNGHDTLYILNHPHFQGQVSGFDIQDQAIQSSLAKINALDPSLQDRVQVYQRGHQEVNEVLADIANYHGAIFNLGYLPGGDKSITTLADTSLSAIMQIADKLAPRGRIIVVLYWGHEAGKTERQHILDGLSQLDQTLFQVSHYEFINQVNYPPSVAVVERLKEG